MAVKAAQCDLGFCKALLRACTGHPSCLRKFLRGDTVDMNSPANRRGSDNGNACDRHYNLPDCLEFIADSGSIAKSSEGEEMPALSPAYGATYLEEGKDNLGAG